MSRKNIVLIFFVVLLPSLSVSATGPDYGLILDPRTSLTLEDTLAVQASFGESPYRITGGSPANCSGFVGRYLAALGFTTSFYTADWNQYQPDPDLPIPDLNAYMQLAWFIKADEAVPESIVRKVPVENLLTLEAFPNLQILPGSLIFFETEDSHLDYNQISHVVIFLGYTVTDRQPLFAEFASGMQHGPVLGRTLLQVAIGMYETDASGHFLTEPISVGTATPDHLYAFIVDPIILGQYLGLLSIQDP